MMVKRYMASARPYAAFAVRWLQLRWQRSKQPKSFLNRELLFSCFNHTGTRPTSFAWSHGADELAYVGSGILYFAIPYMLKAKTCVCIGSGGGYVPRFMHYGQLDANVPGARTIVIDADKGDYGRPDYLHQNSPFRTRFSDIEVVKIGSSEYAAVAKRQDLKIDYLHIDGDHSYQGGLSDYINYLPLMSHKGLITFHDTNGKFPCSQVLPTLNHMGHNVIDLPGIGQGIAIISVATRTTTIDADRADDKASRDCPLAEAALHHESA
jgi:Methyltransferase domain